MNEQNRNFLFAILLSIGVLGLWEFMYAQPQREKAEHIAQQQKIERGVETPAQGTPGAPPSPNAAGAPQTERIIKSIVVKRLGTPEDVARAAMFFLSPDNGFVTGQTLYVCGGTTLGVAPV